MPSSPEVPPGAVDAGEPVADVPAADVLVAGAGPVGCWLAAELCAAGIRVAVVEAREERATWSRGFVVHPRTLEIFDSRGAAGPLLEHGRKLPTWHFAMGSTRLDFTALPTAFPFVLLHPQAQTELLLERHLNRCGGEVRRGQRVVGLEQLADRVAVRVRAAADGAEHTLTARFVVGCDGGRSTVRDSAGIAFRGNPDSMVSPAAHVELTDPPPPERYMLTSERGLFFAIPLPDGRFVVSTIDHEVMGDLDAPWTAETLRASLLRVAGSDFGLGAVERISTIGNSAKQADRYRDGRVLLAGDAAHVHFPMGGQGMNLGIQDAHNLAWRLAAAVRIDRDGRDRGGAAEGAPAASTASAKAVDELLDGYEAERRPAGERVLEDVRAQMALVAATGADGAALRTRFEALLGEHPQVNLQYARRLSGIEVRYPVAAGAGDSEDPRLGRRVPDLLVERADGTPGRLYELVREAGAGVGRYVRLVVGGGGSGGDGDAAGSPGGSTDTRADLGFGTASGAARDGAVLGNTALDGAALGDDAATLAVNRVTGPDWARREGWDLPGSLLIRPDGHVVGIAGNTGHE